MVYHILETQLYRLTIVIAEPKSTDAIIDTMILQFLQIPLNGIYGSTGT